MRTRNWSIRSKIITMVTVPLTALLAVWLFATALTAGPALSLLSARTLADNVGIPGGDVVGELQRGRERTWRILEAEEPDEADLAHERERREEVLLRLAGEADDEGRAHGDVGHDLPPFAQPLEHLRLVGRPLHRLEDLWARMLKRDVEVRQEKPLGH